MADFAGYRVDALSDEELLARALAVAGKMTPERIETARDAGTPEEMARFPAGDQLIRSNYGKLPGVRELIGAGRVAGALGKGAVDSTTQAITASGRAARGEIAPEDMGDEALNLALNVAGAGLGSVKQMGRMAPDQLNMFLGPKAATADLKALDRAKRMSLVGATETDIRNATGWHKGADGEWRFEVPDDKLKVSGATGRIVHPEVDAAYPGLLQSFTVDVGDTNYARPGNLGYMDSPNRKMGIFSPDPAERRSIAAHELQHLIQHHEGWSPGMSVQSPEIGLRLMEPGLRARKVDAKLKAAEGISRFDDSFIEPYFSANMRDRLGVEWGDLSRVEQAAFRNKIMKAAGDQIPQHHIDNYWKNRDIIADGETSPFSHYGQYRREAGEVEARNVQDRLNLTPRQREQIHPRTTEDIPRDEQWVAKRAPQYAWNELPDAEAVSRALDVAARPPVESLVYRAGDELSPEGSGYVAAPGKPSVVTIPGYGKVEARPVQPLLDAAEAYMRSVGRPGQHDVLAFPKLDEDRAGRIAEAYARMAHDPTDPKVAKAYAAMADETMAQYRALRDQGLDFHFLRDGEADPYARSPSLGYPDIIKNGRLTVFPTEQGFGSNELFDPSANPLLKKVGRVGDLEDATVNDAFRAVHDAYGHFGPGNPFFRAPGEERAWVAHSRMYSPEAIPAMTSETRGQNSWLNFGPHKEHNKTALGADTIFADQKTGIMEDWTWALDPDALYPRRASGGRVSFKEKHTPAFRRWFGDSKVVHETTKEPLVVYHGTKPGNVFDIFDLDEAHPDASAFWFTNHEGYAHFVGSGGAGADWRNQKHPEIMPVYLRMEKPVVVDAFEEGKRVAEQIGDPEPQSIEEAEQYIKGSHGYGQLVEQIRQDNPDADGVIIKGTMDGYHTPTEQYVVFSPHQIKSINNAGSFDPEDPRITYATGGRVEAFARGGAVKALLDPAEIDHPVARAMKVVYDDHPARIPQRFIKSKKPTEDPLGDLVVDPQALAASPALMEKNVGLLRAYPNITKQEARRKTPALAEAFIEHAKNNLLWLHDRYAPELRDRAKLWYVGANKIANDWAQEFGHPVASVAGVLAALSPQKDWFMNVSLARRVLDIHAQHQDTTTTPEMEAKLNTIFPAAKYPELHQILVGKKLSEMANPYEKAAWIRLHDEAHGDRRHRIISPEGAQGEYVRNMDGTPSGTGWGSLTQIGNAVAALESGGDRKTLSKLMGGQHKVRNFYNNILSPNSSKGDVTIDTHAVAAALLRPLAGTSVPVSHNFGTYAGKDEKGKAYPNAGGSDITGVQGLYPLYAEAYRRAAKERGILPREMQSITWEAVRGLFKDTWKTKANNAMVDKVWDQYRNGALTLDDARNQIHDLAGGIEDPDWHRPGVGAAGEGQDPAHAGELDQAGLHGLAPGGLGDRARDGAAGGPSPQDPLLTNYLVGRARGGRLKSIGAMATRWSPRPALMPDVDRDPVGNALATLRRRTSL